MAKLGEICSFQSGGTPSKNKPEYFGGEIPWISTTALNGGKINEADAVAWITPKAIRESAAKIVPANSIMVGTRVGIGKVAINTVEMSTSQDVISLIGIDKDKWYKPYLCKLLLSKKDYFNSQARGATIKGIKIDVVANIDVPEIDYATQRKVAATLNKIDTLIVLRKQQLEKLDELIKARFVEMFGDDIYPKVKVSGVCDFITKGTTPPNKLISEKYSSDKVPYLKVYNLSFTGKLLFDTAPQYVPENIHNGVLARSKVYPNDVLMNIVGPPLGKFALVTDEFSEWNINQAIAIFRAKEKVNPNYLLFALMQPEVLKPFLRQAVGIRQLNLSLAQCRDLKIPLPPLSLQSEFAAFVERVDQQKQTVQQSLEKLELMKKVLMQEYFG